MERGQVADERLQKSRGDTLETPGFEGVPRALMGEIDHVLFIVFTTRFMKHEEYYRIISARAAVKNEIEAYKRNRKRLEERA